ncbi:unnamed protein product [Meloidogyne enterolobii]|uniref:Uncharacterized protein n=1 Tax=Meloidogyne enterolobii TaxID=390850 RepID=A0ACB0Z801_MELEN
MNVLKQLHFKIIDKRIFNIRTMRSVAKIDSGRSSIQLRRPEKRLLKLKFDHIPIKDQVVVMFPGYGTQYLTMGRNVIDNPNSKRLFDQANEFLKFDLFDLCQNGPKTKLDQIINSQMAIFVSSLAAFEKLKTEQPDIMEHVAGFGQGEFCALVAANVINYDDALKIMKIYADATESCSKLSYSGMITIRTCAESQLLRALSEAKEYSESKGELPLCELAGYLFCHVKIIAGTMKSLEFLNQHASHFKFQILKRLPIYGAFHTTLMNEAANDVREYLEGIKEINIPCINVYSNYTGRPHLFQIKRIKRDVVRQITNPIKWEQIAQLLFQKRQDEVFPSYIEVGPGKQLGNILYNIGKKTRNTYIHYPP